MIKIKKGVKMHGLKQPMMKPLRLLDCIFQIIGIDLVITDAIAKREGRSLHPDGFAFDFRTRHLTPSQASVIFVILTQQLGNDYDVIKYDTHIHIEYQRHIDDNKQISFISAFGMDKFTEVS